MNTQSEEYWRALEQRALFGKQIPLPPMTFRIFMERVFWALMAIPLGIMFVCVTFGAHVARIFGRLK